MIKYKDSLASSLDSNFNNNKGLKNTFGIANKNLNKDINNMNRKNDPTPRKKLSEDSQCESNINMVQS